MIAISKINFIHIERDESCQADWAFIMDESSSMSKEDFELQKDFLVRLVGELDPRPNGAHVAIFKYAIDNTPILNFNAPQDRLTIEELINQTEFKPAADTRTHNALEYANDTIFSNETGMRLDPIPKNLVVITDGVCTCRISDLTDWRTILEKRNIRLMSVGIRGKELDTLSEKLLFNETISALATSDDFIFYADKFDDIGNLVYNVSYCSGNMNF